MARKLKVYQTSLGFFDQAIAAPSMKAALEAWGADSNLFHQSAARESEEAVAQRERERRQTVIGKAQNALDAAEREHERMVAVIAAERDAVEKRAGAERPDGKRNAIGCGTR
jgi:DNA-binding protein H-NS